MMFCLNLLDTYVLCRYCRIYRYYRQEARYLCITNDLWSCTDILHILYNPAAKLHLFRKNILFPFFSTWRERISYFLRSVGKCTFQSLCSMNALQTWWMMDDESWLVGIINTKKENTWKFSKKRWSSRWTTTVIFYLFIKLLITNINVLYILDAELTNMRPDWISSCEPKTNS